MRIELLARLLAAADARAYDAPLVRDLLRQPDPSIRRQAALAAGRIGDEAAVDPLVAALGDSDQGVQAGAAFALGLLKDPRALPALVALARARPAAGQGTAQAEAVTAIAKVGGDDAARAIAVILASGSASGAAAGPAASAALLEAWRLGEEAPVAALLRFTTDPQVAVRWHALYSLARLRTARGIAALVHALRDPDPFVRSIAVRGVSAALVDSAHLDRDSVLAKIGPLLGDPDARVRINALRALGTFRDSSLAEAVVPVVTDARINVAMQAETTLGVLGGSEAVAALRQRLASSVLALRRQALIALAEADTAAGVSAALGFARDPDWRWRSVAAEALGAARARGPLEELLADTDGRVAAQALQQLQRVVPERDSSLSVRARALLAHPDPAVRSVAADLVARHPLVEDVERLVAAYQRAEGDPFNDARLSAVAALAAIARSGDAGREAVATRFVAAVPRPDDYLVRRLAASRLPEAARVWGPVPPIATGQSDADYREIVRRYLLPALAGRPRPRVTLETGAGRLRVELLPAEAPLTAAAFLSLVARRYFDGARWHRVVPNFVVQDGDPRGDGWGGPGFSLRDEINPTRYETGTLGMALSGPDTGGSQFFITLSPQPHLDGTYTVFGRVVSGFDVLERVAQGDPIRSVRR